MFIVIEGGEGVGKTTLGAILARRLGAMLIATPPQRYFSVREKIDREGTPGEHYRFYRDGIYEASVEIKRLLALGAKVVADRYWLTTYTSHQVMGVSVSADDFQSVMQPDMTVILSLNEGVQAERIRRRRMSINDRKLLDKQQDITAALYRNALDLGIPFVVLDTQRFDPEACVRIVLRVLEA